MCVVVRFLLMSKAKEAIKEIRKREDYHFQRSVWCREHNLELDALKHQEIENELKQIAFKIEDIFDTGFVGRN